jgi:hypothetical protein
MLLPDVIEQTPGENRAYPTFSFNSASLTGLLVLGVGKGGSGAFSFDMLQL